MKQDVGMKKPGFLIYGVACYAAAIATLVYAALFFGNFAVPRTIDEFGAMPIRDSLAVNAALIVTFALQHSGMARPGFKRWLARIVSNCMLRSTYVLFSSLSVSVLMALWQPIGILVWSVEAAVPRNLIVGTYFGGWLLMLWATCLIDHLEFFGLRQTWTAYQGRNCPESSFQTPGVYRHIRHPIHTGWLIVLWATPMMTLTHLLLAIGMTIYVLIGVHLEEHGLNSRFREYAQYMRKVPMLLPSPHRRLDE